MKTPPTDNPESLSVVSVVFPINKDTDIMNILHKIKDALPELPTLKIDARIVLVKDQNGGLVNKG